MLNITEPHSDTLRCYSQAPGEAGLMVGANGDSYTCPFCEFAVRLNAKQVPASWYDHWVDARNPVSTDDPALPFCETCSKPMIAAGFTINPVFGTKSIFFLCREGDTIVHRLEAYFVKMPTSDFEAFRELLKESYALYMIRDVCFDALQIIEGPDVVEFDPLRLPDDRRQEILNKLPAMKFVGILLELEISDTKVRLKFDKDLLKRKLMLIVQEPTHPA